MRERIAHLLAAGCDSDLRGWVVGGAVPLVDKCGDGLSEVDQTRLRAVLVECGAARLKRFGGHSPGDRRSSEVRHALRHVHHAWARGESVEPLPERRCGSSRAGKHLCAAREPAYTGQHGLRLRSPRALLR